MILFISFIATCCVMVFLGEFILACDRAGIPVIIGLFFLYFIIIFCDSIIGGIANFLNKFSDEHAKNKIY